MANPVWTGTISFGLVSVGVRMYSARERHGPKTHQFVRGTSSRVRYRRVDEDTGEPVANKDVVKGAEVDDTDDYVLLEPEELERIQPGRSKALEIDGFIDPGRVDPLWYASSYYLGPDKSSSKPYGLLFTALERSERAGLGRMIMRGREHLVLIAPQQGVLTASTLWWPDEIRDPEDVMRPPSADTDDEELELATRLIDAMATEWAPQTYTDEYEVRLEELIEAKAKGGTLSYEREEPAEESKVVALDDALRASLERRRKSRETKKSGRAPRPRASDDPKVTRSGKATKAELLEQAKRLKISGRSKMTREELAQAVADAG